MDYKPKKRLTEEQKAKKRENYRANRDKILEYQHSPEYIENRKAQRENSAKYKNYQKFYQEEYQKDPENRARRNEAVVKFQKNNPEKTKESNRKWWAEHRDEQRERRTQYMREYRARKKAEKSQESDENGL